MIHLKQAAEAAPRLICFFLETVRAVSKKNADKEQFDDSLSLFLSLQRAPLTLFLVPCCRFLDQLLPLREVKWCLSGALFG